MRRLALVGLVLMASFAAAGPPAVETHEHDGVLHPEGFGTVSGGVRFIFLPATNTANGDVRMSAFFVSDELQGKAIDDWQKAGGKGDLAIHATVVSGVRGSQTRNERVIVITDYKLGFARTVKGPVRPSPSPRDQ